MAERSEGEAPSTGRSIRIDVARTQVLQVLILINVALWLLHIVSSWLWIYGEERLNRDFEGATLMNMDFEVSIPTWYAQTIVFIAAVLTLVVGILRRRTQAGDDRYWMGLAAVLLFVSVDEGSSIHERFTEPLQDGLGIAGGPLYYAWVVVGVLALAVFALVFFRFWLRLPERPRLWIAVGGAVFVTGGLGVEMIGGAYMAEYGETFTYFMIAGLEEFLEKTGTAFYIYGALCMIQHCLAERRLEVRVA